MHHHGYPDAKNTGRCAEGADAKYLELFERYLASTEDCYFPDHTCTCHSPIVKIEGAVYSQQHLMDFA